MNQKIPDYSGRIAKATIDGRYNLSPDFRNHKTSLDLLISDIRTIFEYVEPRIENKLVYSHRLFSLLLRGCTEFESTNKFCLREIGESTDGCNILNYIGVGKDLELDKIKASVIGTDFIDMQPFESFSKNESPAWYREYNSVKHNRNDNFKSANIINALHSIVGVRILLGVIGRYHDYKMQMSDKGQIAVNADFVQIKR